MYYIQETDKPSFLLKFFNIINLESNKIILPIKDEIISEKKAEQLAKRTKVILDTANCKRIVISKKLKNCKNYINYLYTYQYEIIDGKWLCEVLANEILEFIIKKKEMKKQETQIDILVNDLTEITLNNIRTIIKEYKRVNIITNHIEKFRKIEKEILEKEGIMITVSNNKKKSLSKSKIILNVDFPTELINKYNINDNAIIINLRGNVRINKKRFNGVNINDYEIEFDDGEELDDDDKKRYKKTEIYEAKFYKKTPVKNIKEILEKDNVRIISLKGVNSEIKI